MKMVGKRILAIILLGLMISSTCACEQSEGKDPKESTNDTLAEQNESTNDAVAEEFTFHNGLKFGMSQEEVIEIEKANEIELTTNIKNYKFLGSLYGAGRFVGVGSEMWFSFSGGKLVSAVYYMSDHFDRDTFEDIDGKLTEKYGKGQSIKYKFSVDGKSALDLYQSDELQSRYSADSYSGNSYAFNPDIELQTQRLVPCEGGYIEIQQIDPSFYFYNGMSGYEGTVKFYDSIVSYRFITEEAYQETINKILQNVIDKENTFNNDL